MGNNPIPVGYQPDPYGSARMVSWFAFRYLGPGFFVLITGGILLLPGGIDWHLVFMLALTFLLGMPTIASVGFLLSAWSQVRDFDEVTFSGDRVLFTHSYRDGRAVALPGPTDMVGEEMLSTPR